ncbi:MAG: YIP1 family protein [Rhodobacteraceae bacterium]|nr:YIP1 family protein [Paracoccaceae bacterium]
MAISKDILATYRGPATVVRRLLSMGPREDRALVYLMAGCALVFTSQLPALSRQAYLTGAELNPLLGGALLGWVFIAPLFFYVLAAISHAVALGLGGRGDWYGARLALFWAFLASAPLILLYGLVAGFVGPGPALNLTGGFWVVAFLWFWIAGLREAEKGVMA